jgi:hypothetical protein
MRRNSFPNRGSSNSQRRDNPPPPEQEPVPTAVKVLGAAAIFGAIVGLGSVSIGKGGPERIASSANDLPAKADAPHIRPLQASERIEPLDNSLSAKAGKPHARPLQVSEPIEPQDNSLPVKAGILRARPRRPVTIGGDAMKLGRQEQPRSTVMNQAIAPRWTETATESPANLIAPCDRHRFFRCQTRSRGQGDGERA